MNPLTLYPSLALVALLTVGGFYKYGHSNGWDDRDAEMQVEIARKNEEARELERAMNSKIIANANKLQEANHALDKKQTDLNAAIRAGRVRLPSASCPQASPSAPATSGDRDETPSESDRETLRLIAQIAADGDRAINQLNACIDAYDQMRSIINGDK
jgi:hypothetical protein